LLTKTQGVSLADAAITSLGVTDGSWRIAVNPSSPSKAVVVDIQISSAQGKVVQSFSDVASFGANLQFVAAVDAKERLFVRHAKKLELSATLALPSPIADVVNATSSISRIWTLAGPSSQIRLFVLRTDGSIEFVTATAELAAQSAAAPLTMMSQWKREEALSSVSDSVVLDEPLSTETLLDEFAYSTSLLSRFISLLTPHESEHLARDVLENRHLVVFATQRGLLLAQHSESKATIWRRFYAQQNIVRVLTARQSLRRDRPALLYVLMKHVSTGAWTLDVVDAFTGLSVQLDGNPVPRSLPFTVEYALTLPSVDSSSMESIFPLVLVSRGTAGVSVVPDKPSMIAAMKHSLAKNPQFVFIYRNSTKAVTGYELTANCTLNSALCLAQRWQQQYLDSVVQVSAISSLNDN